MSFCRRRPPRTYLDDPIPRPQVLDWLIVVGLCLGGAALFLFVVDLAY